MDIQQGCILNFSQHVHLAVCAIDFEDLVGRELNFARITVEITRRVVLARMSG
jgi:hypothetical protein